MSEKERDFLLEQLIGLRQQVRNIERQLTDLLVGVSAAIAEDEPEPEPARPRPPTFGS